MGKGSGKAKTIKEDELDKGIKQQGPGLSDPVGPLLQLSGLAQMPGMSGQLDFSNNSFGGQLAALPPELLEQIRMAGEPRPVPTAPVIKPKKKATDKPGFVNGQLYHHPWGLPVGTYKMPEEM